MDKGMQFIDNQSNNPVTDLSMDISEISEKAEEESGISPLMHNLQQNFKQIFNAKKIVSFKLEEKNKINEKIIIDFDSPAEDDEFAIEKYRTKKGKTFHCKNKLNILDAPVIMHKKTLEIVEPLVLEEMFDDKLDSNLINNNNDNININNANFNNNNFFEDLEFISNERSTMSNSNDAQPIKKPKKLSKSITTPKCAEKNKYDFSEFVDNVRRASKVSRKSLASNKEPKNGGLFILSVLEQAATRKKSRKTIHVSN